VVLRAGLASSGAKHHESRAPDSFARGVSCAAARKFFGGNEICFARKREIRFTSAKPLGFARRQNQKRLDLPHKRGVTAGKTRKSFACGRPAIPCQADGIPLFQSLLARTSTPTQAFGPSYRIAAFQAGF
jgi:hypothetical protein